MSDEVQDRPATRAELEVDNDLPPMLHLFPGYEFASCPPVPVGAVAFCGYRNQGIRELLGDPARRDCCVVCEACV